MRVSQETITPAIAEKYLKKNTFNRPLSPGTVRRYAIDLENGLWVQNGETVKFNCDGTLIDGQHRLKAISNSGIPAKMIVVRGLEKKVFANIDNGRKRNLADLLAILGYKHHQQLSGALRGCYSYYTFGYEGMFTARDVKGYGYINNTLYLDFIEQNESVYDDFLYVHSVKASKALLSTGTLTTFYHIAKKKDEEDAENFVERLLLGDELSADSPIYKLRKKLIEIRMEKLRISQTSLFVHLAITWNAWRNGSQLKHLRVENVKLPELG